jgi:hypothetical protein
MSTATQTKDLGILGGDPDWEASLARVEARRQRERQRLEDIERKNRQIGALWGPGLSAEIDQECAALCAPHIQEDVEEFEAFCRKHSFPTFPAVVGALVAFLGRAKKRDVARLYNSLCIANRARLDDATDAPIVRAVVAAARTSKRLPQANGNGTDHQNLVTKIQKGS